MDPAEFGISSLPLQHHPYPAISSETLAKSNEGKLAVVTGAAGGIGAAIALSLAKSGTNLALLDLPSSSQEATKSSCLNEGVKVITYGCNVADLESMRTVFGKIEKELGSIDILVNNAGICEMRPFAMSTIETVWRQVEVNFKGPLITSSLVLPSMRARRQGCIINIASRSGTVDVPMFLGYNTSKAAVIRMSATLQRELEVDGFDEDIQIYALHPGGVLTAMGGAETALDVKEKYGVVKDEAFYKDLFKDTPSLCGQTCAFLVSGKGKELRGLYLDCRQDVTKLLAVGREGLKSKQLNMLGVNFLEGYCNEP
ncbi:short chain dehydrogenase/reductase-like protein SDR [Stipitochalara longipes BDJ]|nr:short chain dehydrogenase/reductase-like protein SDR [Stipitochalara longipes BDJ]